MQFLPGPQFTRWKEINLVQVWVSLSAVTLPCDVVGPQIQWSSAEKVDSYFYSLLKFLFIYFFHCAGRQA